MKIKKIHSDGTQVEIETESTEIVAIMKLLMSSPEMRSLVQLLNTILPAIIPNNTIKAHLGSFGFGSNCFPGPASKDNKDGDNPFDKFTKEKEDLK